jgi:TolB-like protein
MRSANAHITLTVFPFEDLSLQRELGIFCRSFSVDLVTELSRFRQFQVISLPERTNDAEPATTRLVEDLQTDYFIQGTFRCEQELATLN